MAPTLPTGRRRSESGTVGAIGIGGRMAAPDVWQGCPPWSRGSCVYCGSNVGRVAGVRRGGRGSSARRSASRGIGLVYGGGHVGLMGAARRRRARRRRRGDRGDHRASSSEPRSPTRGSPSCRSSATMHERKARMADLADGFIALPGGFGTFDEVARDADVEPARPASPSRSCFLDVDGYLGPAADDLRPRGRRPASCARPHRMLAQPGRAPSTRRSPSPSRRSPTCRTSGSTAMPAESIHERSWPRAEWDLAEPPSDSVDADRLDAHARPVRSTTRTRSG